MFSVASLVVLAIVIIFLSAAILLVVTYMISTLMSQPFVPTSKNDMMHIVQFSNLISGQTFLELGSGDGRFIQFVVKNIGVKGTGIESNPILVLLAKLRSLFTKTEYTIKLGDIKKFSYSNQNVIYLFLFPSLIEKIQDKFLKECSPGTMVISHGFVIPAIHKYLENTLPGTGFRTYIYRIPASPNTH